VFGRMDVFNHNHMGIFIQWGFSNSTQTKKFVCGSVCILQLLLLFPRLHNFQSFNWHSQLCVLKCTQSQNFLWVAFKGFI